MICERYRLVLHHEIYDMEKGELHPLDPPIVVTHSGVLFESQHTPWISGRYIVNKILEDLKDFMLQKLSEDDPFKRSDDNVRKSD